MVPPSMRRTMDISRRQFLVASGVTGLGSISGCVREENGPGTNGSTPAAIAVAGSSTVFPLMSAIAEEFSREHGNVSIDISSTGTGGGFSNFFCVGQTDFNNASRQIKPAERELCQANGVGWVELVVAIDALTVVVNTDATFIDCLTVEELAQIWEADAAETWSEVRSNWPNEPIDRYGPDDTSGTYDYFLEHVQGEARGHTDDYQATEQDNTIVQGVRGNTHAIGYLGFSYFFNNPGEVKAVAIDNGTGCVKPTLETASAGEYKPLSRQLYTYAATRSLEKIHVAEFARFMVEQTTNEDLVARDVGYVPLSEEEQAAQRDKLEAAIAEAKQ